MFLKRSNKILEILLKYFVRLNFNRKKDEFKKIHKHEFAIFFNDTLSKEITIDAIFEKDEILEILKLIKKRNCFIDVGANIGNHSIFFSRYFKKIYSFEAHPKTYDILNFNTKEYSNIKIFNIGLSNFKGNLFFKKNITSNIGGKYLTKKGQIKAKVNKLDKILKKLKNVNYIKLDVEGHEYSALIGMKNTLKYNSPLLQVEL